MADTETDLDAHARALVDANLYVALGTADADGSPWVTPVYFATADYADYYWVSAEDAAHSRNIEARPEVSMVIFDSQVPDLPRARPVPVRDRSRGGGRRPRAWPGGSTWGAAIRGASRISSRPT